MEYIYIQNISISIMEIQINNSYNWLFPKKYIDKNLYIISNILFENDIKTVKKSLKKKIL